MTPCSVCRGPFHPATGHEFETGGRWCGPCTRDFIKFLKTQQGRRWGKMSFYEHACPPPAVSRFCECRYCIEAGRYIPRAGGGRYEAVRGVKAIPGGPEWGVQGPGHGCEHVLTYWPCAGGETEARAMAESMNGGWVPPEVETCDGCKKEFPVEMLMSRETKAGKFAYCPSC